MSFAVRFVPPADDAEITFTVSGVFAVKVAIPDAMACFTLPSGQVLSTITWELATLSAAPPGTSPSLNPSPTVNGEFPPTGEVSWNDVIVLPEGGGGALWLFTVTVTPALVAELFDVSVAIARTMCEPLLTDVESHEIEYGDVVSGGPKFVPSIWNCTLATATLSEAFALSVTFPLTVLPETGVVIETVGGVVSGVPFFTVTVTLELVALLLAASVTIAVSEWFPLLDFVVSHE